MTVVQYTYLDESVDRVLAMLREVSSVFDPKILRVEKRLDLTLSPPLWWVYPGVGAPEAVAAQLEAQQFALNLRLVLGIVGSGYKGELSDKLWLWTPTVMNYFRQRQSLIYEAGQAPIKYLDVPNVRIQQSSPFGEFTAQNHIGIEFQLMLSFTLSLSPVLGN